jgi:hypothetical protein
LNKTYRAPVEHRQQVLANYLNCHRASEDRATDLKVLKTPASAGGCDGSLHTNDAEIGPVLPGHTAITPRTIGRINNPRHAWLFDQKLHVDVALNESAVLAHLIGEEMSLGDMMTLLKLRRGEYSLVSDGAAEAKARHGD